MPGDESRWIALEPRLRETLRGALERSLREAIRAGALRPGVPLPSSRTLAASLGVSRGVVTDAYDQLSAQGFLITRVKATPLVGAVARPPAPARARPPAPPPRFDLSPSTPEVALFPTGRWTEAMVGAIRSAPVSALGYGSPRGEPALREALADHLGRTRGVVADPERIVILNGAAQGIILLAHALSSAGARRVAVEDPSLESQPHRLRMSGLQVAGQPVDAEGLTLDGLAADAVLVTPAHQFPTGAVLSGPRRRDLLAWARQHGALIVEDDYDAEFRYDREPAPALQGLDPDRVAYLGTASKTLAPALRLGWLLLPARLAEEAETVKHLLDVCSPALEQLALARLLTSGAYDRHIRQMRAVYRRRRDALLWAVEHHLPGLTVAGVAAGIHGVVWLPPGVDDRRVAVEAEREGVRVAPLSQFRIDHPVRPGLALGYGRVTETALDDAVAALARAVRHARSHP
ncbi:MAG: PLP-dependent aminotransferase family protein [Candidatus Dormiibacterota bacterium]|jgi:GntR family transcriptional regulator/MocR family aminotransferase